MIVTRTAWVLGILAFGALVVMAIAGFGPAVPLVITAVALVALIGGGNWLAGPNPHGRPPAPRPGPPASGTTASGTTASGTPGPGATSPGPAPGGGSVPSEGPTREGPER